jgi:hypothetical protein
MKNRNNCTLSKKLLTCQKEKKYSSFEGRDQPEFGSVPVPAEIMTGTKIPVSVPAMFTISVPDEILVQM